MGVKKSNYSIIVHYLILLWVIYLVVFLKLGSFHMRWWDESMFAVNTYEMIESGDYFSFSYNGKPDLYNTKPPLTNWLQILFVKIFGYNELSLRLPSALAACFSIIFIFKFTAKYFGYILAWLSALVLLTSTGFIGYHTARTADSDSLLTFFLLITNLSFIGFILNDKKSNVLIFFIFITLAFNTKLYAAFLFIPAYIFILIYFKKFKKFVVNKIFLFGLLFFLISSVSIIYLREIESPGYLSKIFFNDAGRLFNALEVHSRSSFYYLDNLFSSHFSFWIIFFILGSILIFHINKNTKYTILFSTFVLVVSYLLIITLSLTKLQWYDMPIFPYLALVSGFSIHFFIKKVLGSKNKSDQIKQYSMVILVSIYPFLIMFGKSQANTIGLGERLQEADELYLFNAIKKDENLNGIKVLFHGWNGGLLFYKYKLLANDQEIELHTNIKDFHINDKILVSNDSLKIVLEDSFSLEKLSEYHASKLYRIKDIKEK